MDVGLREEKRAETWRAIRRAGLALMQARGFDDVSVDEIAAAARVSRTTFFNYFASKEAVVFDAPPDAAATWRALFDARPADEPVWESLAAIVTAHLGATAGDIAVQKALKRRSPKLAASFGERRTTAWPELRAWLAARIGEDPPGMTFALTLAAAVSVTTTAYELWDESRGAEHLVALLREGFARVRVEAR